MTLRILSGGAANGLVSALSDRVLADTGHKVKGDFGAVGVMRDRFLGGEAVDALILTRAIIDDLVASGHVDPNSVRDIGKVATGIAVLEGRSAPALATPDDLGTTLTAADTLYVPDTTKSTAGAHVASMLSGLGLAEMMAPRLREFPNGQTAMAAMVKADEARSLGCTQITEIINTPGVEYAGDLPEPYGLTTTYTAALPTGAGNAAAAERLVQILTSENVAQIRSMVGFAP